MSGGGSDNIESGQAWHPRFQQPVGRQLGSMIQGGLQGPLPFQPPTSELPDVYDPALTQQYFQQAILNPAMTQLTGQHGTLSRIGAGQAQRGTYFSSGRQQQEADAVLGTGAQLGQAYASLIGQDQQVNQAEWMRRQPFSGQMTKQALNFLGTPMMTAYQEQKGPWGALGGAAGGAILGTLLAPATGGASLPWGIGMGTMMGAGMGGAVGGMF